MFLRDLGDHHFVLRLATVLKQNLEHFPKSAQDAPFVLCMRNAFLDHFVETNRVDKHCPVNTLNVLQRHALCVQVDFVDHVPLHRVLVRRPQDDTWDVQGLRSFQGVVDPGLHHARGEGMRVRLQRCNLGQLGFKSLIRLQLEGLGSGEGFTALQSLGCLARGLMQSLQVIDEFEFVAVG